MTSLAAVAFALGAVFASSEGASEPAVVQSLDLNRYTGTWYEIARYPNRFEKACVRDVTAEYSVRADGKIDVVNRCRKANGQQKVAKGTAVRAQKNGPASKLKVSFFWPFYGDYWVLDPDYKWALIGSPKRDYLWILSRSSQIDQGTYGRIVEKARSLGFDPARLIRTPQGS